jgi:hypothetical protein
MRVKDGTPAAMAERPATAKVAPRFTRAAQAERSRLQGRREQLLRKREAAQAEVAQIDVAVSEVDELLGLLAPLLLADGSESARYGDGTEPDAEPAGQDNRRRSENG